MLSAAIALVAAGSVHRVPTKLARTTITSE
jgi:hypothetical protein